MLKEQKQAFMLNSTFGKINLNNGGKLKALLAKGKDLSLESHYQTYAAKNDVTDEK